MLLNSKNLNGLPVKTKLGDLIGHINGFDLETQSGMIKKYYAIKGGIINLIRNNELIIDREQVIEINEEVMIVDDNTIKTKEKGTKLINEKIEVEPVSPVITRETE